MEKVVEKNESWKKNEVFIAFLILALIFKHAMKNSSDVPEMKRELAFYPSCISTNELPLRLDLTEYEEDLRKCESGSNRWFSIEFQLSEKYSEEFLRQLG